ncbi:MAG: hypothetical protein Q9N34_05975 [Aquificota bacterium]|nr:hypothetical protein [Aquificota bacterium]
MFTLLIDMDGVLTKDKEFTPFDYATTFIKDLKERGVPFRIVSNNSTRPPELIVHKLRTKGFDITGEDFISPVGVLPDYLEAPRGQEPLRYRDCHALRVPLPAGL